LSSPPQYVKSCDPTLAPTISVAPIHPGTPHRSPMKCHANSAPQSGSVVYISAHVDALTFRKAMNSIQSVNEVVANPIHSNAGHGRACAVALMFTNAVEVAVTIVSKDIPELTSPCSTSAT
jgi:hypothetical protein